jgi:thiamine biosynthesis lipoprotein
VKSASPVLVARNAMATRFEIALHGDNPASLRAAGEQALDEIDRLESTLSLYRANTDIARVNAHAHEQPVRVTPEVFRLLQLAREISEETNGAFDITIAPLVRCWGFMGGTGAMPRPEAIDAARACVGMALLDLDSDDFTVRFRKPGVMLDLGAIGKGYAVDQAAEVLRETGIVSALIHGGTSSACAIGRLPNGAPWKLAITSPRHEPEKPFALVELADESLSVSAVWGRSFEHHDTSYGHVIDPRTGKPARAALLAAVIHPSATEGDALTTALLTEPGLLDALCARRPAMRCAVVSGDPTAPAFASRGICPLAA